ncbi:unnamed protein product, partial [Chrysoparadoxa australica]
EGQAVGGHDPLSSTAGALIGAVQELSKQQQRYLLGVLRGSPPSMGQPLLLHPIKSSEGSSNCAEKGQVEAASAHSWHHLASGLKAAGQAQSNPSPVRE